VITINGTPNAIVQPGTSVRAMLDLLGIDAEARGVAVAVDAEVVPRPQWPAFRLTEEAHVEVLNAVQGG
jgi:sulfur carrier protein